MTPRERITVAQRYDLEHRTWGQSWSRVPDHQVERLLIGAGVIPRPPEPPCCPSCGKPEE